MLGADQGAELGSVLQPFAAREGLQARAVWEPTGRCPRGDKAARRNVQVARKGRWPHTQLEIDIRQVRVGADRAVALPVTADDAQHHPRTHRGAAHAFHVRAARTHLGEEAVLLDSGLEQVLGVHDGDRRLEVARVGARRHGEKVP